MVFFWVICGKSQVGEEDLMLDEQVELPGLSYLAAFPLASACFLFHGKFSIKGLECRTCQILLTILEAGFFVKTFSPLLEDLLGQPPLRKVHLSLTRLDHLSGFN